MKLNPSQLLRTIHVGLSCFLLIFLTVSGFGQSFRTEKYDIENGLPSNSISDILQDSQGRMWIVTRGGIVVYDGNSWLKQNPAIKSKTQLYKQVVLAPDKSIWIIPQNLNTYIQYYRDGEWLAIEPPPANNSIRLKINYTAILQKGNRLFLAVGTRKNGIFIWNSKEWVHLISGENLPSVKIRGITVWNGLFYIATTSGLATIDGDRLVPLPDKLISQIPSKILGITADIFPLSQNAFGAGVWLAGKNWIGFLSGEQFKKYKTPFNIDVDFPYDYLVMEPDGIGGLFVGNPSGLIYFDPKNKTLLPLGKSNGLLAAGVTSLFRDRENNLWIGSKRGLTKLSLMRFANYGKEQGLLEDEVTVIRELRPGVFVFGHNNGISIFDENSGEVQRIAFRPSNLSGRVLDMRRARDGGFWIAALERGLAKLSLEGQVRWLPNKIFSRTRVNSVFEDRDGVLWIGTGQGLYQMRNGSLKSVNPDGNNSNLVIRRVGELEDGSFFALTINDGIFLLSGGKWKNFTNPAVPQANSVFSLYQLEDGSLIAGTSAGLFLIENGQWQRYLRNQLFIDKPVYFILRDSRKRFWYGTDDGIYRWDEQKWVHYTTLSGVAGPEMNRAAAIEDSHGHFWFGSDRGVSQYQERFDIQSVPPPLVALDSIEVNGVNLNPSQLNSLSYGQNDLTFYFHVISFISEKNVRIRTRLKGFENKWNRIDFRNTFQLRYPNLKPGTYQFQILARNALGKWSKIKSSSNIKINIPVWRRIWFYPILVLGIGILVIAIFILITRERYLGRLENEVALRTSQLSESEKKFRTLFEESRDALYISTPEGRILDINTAGIQLFGYDSRQELLALDIGRDLFTDKADRAIFREHLEKKGSVQDYELLLKKKNGQKIVALVTATIDKDNDGEIIAYRGSIRDVTEQRELEERLFQAQKMESIGTLAGGIAHDFNNILGGILGYASFIKMKMKESDPTYKYVDIIESGATRAAELTSQLLAFARGGRYDVRPLNLNNGIRDILKIIGSTFDKNIEIITQLPDNLPTIEGDASQIQQVIMNLCVNARDAMSDGGRLIISTDTVLISDKFASLHPGAYGGKFVQLTIEDTGIGIDEDTRKRIFEPFFSTKQKGKGTGLGLAMVYGTVKSHDGYIMLDSKPGKGTKFRILFPISGKSETQAEKTPENVKIGNETILIVDDEPNIRLLLADLLESTGYRVISAEDGLQALEIYKKQQDRIDLVILDMVMPRMGGRETYQELINVNPAIRVLFSSGYMADSTIQDFIGSEQAFFVQKPYRVNDLLAKVRAVLDKKDVLAASR